MDEEKETKTAKEKVDDLKEAIKECGFQVEEAENGEIRISE